MKDNLECWKSINGFEGIYQISNFGRVKSLNYKNTGREQIHKKSLNSKGYCVVGLYKNKKTHMKLVHRIVAEHFIENVFNYQQVNHINEIKDDNRVCNLEWCSAKQNSNYGTRIARMRSKKVIMYLDLNEDK